MAREALEGELRQKDLVMLIFEARRRDLRRSALIEDVLCRQ